VFTSGISARQRGSGDPHAQDRSRVFFAEQAHRAMVTVQLSRILSVLLIGSMGTGSKSRSRLDVWRLLGPTAGPLFR